MGVPLSCPFAKCSEVESGFESVVVKSINFGDGDVKTPVRSVSFNGRDSEPKVLKSLGSGRMTLETSVSFKRNELEKMVSIKNPSTDSEKNKPISAPGQKTEEIQLKSRIISDCFSPHTALEPNSPKHMAALKLQKVYKSFRTRRKLADCAILVEQSWWKLLDFAELKHSSISFFDIEKHETALSRWSRARTRAAKVGKGLSKDGKAQKLALQHWLEAIDPRHRYGHNLHFYYDKWLHCQSKEPFFYWLDIGEGKEVNLEKCPRSKLQQQCIKYLGPMERSAYEVVAVDGKFQYKESGDLLHTNGDDEFTKWIFVLSTSKTLYVGKKKKGTFQHSSFLAGGATSAAGRLVAEHGILKAVWPHSGHYRPTEENFEEFVSFLKDNSVDLSDVKLSPVDEDDDSLSTQRSSIHLRSNSSEEYIMEDITGMDTEDINVEELTGEKENLRGKGSGSTTLKALKSRSRFQSFRSELTNLKIPKRGPLVDAYQSENGHTGLISNNLQIESSIPGYGIPDSSVLENDDMILNENMFDEEDDETEIEIIPEESILKRINSHKEARSYQLGKQLSCKWTTGAGPRIGCVRDYPCELQFRALEQVSLSPRSASSSRAYFSPRFASRLSPKPSMVTSRDNAAEAKNLFQTWQHPSRTQSPPLDIGSY